MIKFYDELDKLENVSSVMLMLDGFIYKEIPDDLMTFTVLATSQSADVMPQASTSTAQIFHPCWRKNDIFELGKSIFGGGDQASELTAQQLKTDLEKRSFYAGGSVREFCKKPGVLRISMNQTISKASDMDRETLFSNIPAGIKNANVDRIRRIFVNDPENPKHYLDCKLLDSNN